MERTPLFIGKTDQANTVMMLASMANRHGLVAGATGTGKTVTLRILAEAFSDIGVPVFSADIKGDLAGLAKAGVSDNIAINNRAEKLGIAPFSTAAYPVAFWDVYGEAGAPLRTTVSEFGPLLLTRLFDLSDTQEGVLSIAFRLADDQGLPLLDLKDLRAVLTWMGDHADDIQTSYGNVSRASIGAIQRDLLTIEEAGGDKFFGEPAVKLSDLMHCELTGKGCINILDATKLVNEPRLYTTFLLWLLSELFEQLPEVGDLEKPKMVFFFDEAHLLFDTAPKALLEKIEQLVRLIRSKGVGIFFVTQNPLDIPDAVLGQLGNRFQHALRAFTPRDQKAVRAAAETFRANDSFKTESVICELAVGEALVSCLDNEGVPTVVERTWVAPPRSRLGPISAEERKEILARSPHMVAYKESIDRESAYEILMKRMRHDDEMQHDNQKQPKSSGSRRQGFIEAFLKSAVRTIGNQLGREVLRGIFGNTSRRR